MTFFRYPLAEKFHDLLFCEYYRIHSLALQHLLGKLFLFLLDINDLLLDRTLGDEFVNCHDILLPDTVCTVGCLILHGNVPPWIVMDDDVRCGEVQSGSSCL